MATTMSVRQRESGDERPKATGVSIRVAGEADVGALAALRRAWNEESAGGPIDDDEFDAKFVAWWEVERASRTFFLAEVGGIAVGMVNVKRYDRMPVAGWASSGGWWGYVGNMFVLPDRRNAGIGRVLMEEVIAWAGRARMEHLRLSPSQLAKPFYARLGFAPGAVVEFDPRQG